MNVRHCGLTLSLEGHLERACESLSYDTAVPILILSTHYALIMQYSESHGVRGITSTPMYRHVLTENLGRASVGGGQTHSVRSAGQGKPPERACTAPASSDCHISRPDPETVQQGSYLLHPP